MANSRVPIIRRFGVLGAVLLLALLGLATSATSAAATGSGSDHHGKHGIEHFLGLQTDPNGSPIVIANGPIHAHGTDTQVNNNNDVFVFPDGSLNVHHTAKHDHMAFDPVTCSGTQTETGNYTIHGGSGAYSHARGHGHYSFTAIFFGCDQNAPPQVFSLVLKATGPLHL